MSNYLFEIIFYNFLTMLMAMFRIYDLYACGVFLYKGIFDSLYILDIIIDSGVRPRLLKPIVIQFLLFVFPK